MYLYFPDTAIIPNLAHDETAFDIFSQTCIINIFHKWHLIYLENFTLYSRDCTEPFLIWVRWDGGSILAAKKMFSGRESAGNEEIKRKRKRKIDR
jgi:hypothetical protein